MNDKAFRANLHSNHLWTLSTGKTLTLLTTLKLLDFE